MLFLKLFITPFCSTFRRVRVKRSPQLLLLLFKSFNSLLLSFLFLFPSPIFVVFFKEPVFCFSWWICFNHRPCFFFLLFSFYFKASNSVFLQLGENRLAATRVSSSCICFSVTLLIVLLHIALTFSSSAANTIKGTRERERKETPRAR